MDRMLDKSCSSQSLGSIIAWVGGAVAVATFYFMHLAGRYVASNLIDQTSTMTLLQLQVRSQYKWW